MSKMSKARRKEAQQARQNRQEIIKAGLSRREMMRLGLLTAGGLLVPMRGLSARARDSAGHLLYDDCESPATSAFPPGWELPTDMNGLMPVIQPFNSAAELTGPAPTVAPNTNINPATGLPYEGRTRAHQFPTRFQPVKFYEVHQRRTLSRMHPDLPLQPVWGFGRKSDPASVAFSPGVTYKAHYNEPIMVRNFNDLPNDNEGFGINQVSTHLHNGHTASESDGFPCDWFRKGQYYDQRYANVYAGFDTPEFSPNGDPREALSTLWYHDHRVEFTAQNVYKGLAGFYLLFNDKDTGVEGQGFNLPAHPNFDIPLILNDKVFDEDSKLLCFDMSNFDGILGDKFLVNGRINPTFQVQPRRYRFRVLDGGPARFYQLFLTNLSALSRTNSFWQISNDGNLLPAPVPVTSVKLGVAERADIIIDFSQYKGQTIYLENRLRQDDGRGPMGEEIRPAGSGNLLLKFVVGNTAVTDPSTPMEGLTFYQLPPKNLTPRVTRTFEFSRSGGDGWRINDRLMPGDCSENRFTVQRNSVEKWVFVNNSGGWQHPIHIHMEEFQILNRSRGGAVPHAAVENSRKDVVRLRDNERVEVFFRFRDWRNVYPIHCHNTIHEDHAMMLTWRIEDVGDTKTRP